MSREKKEAEGGRQNKSKWNDNFAWMKPATWLNKLQLDFSGNADDDWYGDELDCKVTPRKKYAASALKSQATSKSPSRYQRPASIQQQTVHRSEQFYRRYFHSPPPCTQNFCPRNRENDPFCLCRLEARTPKTAASTTLSGTPVGLENLGNTSYMNSYLQTLFHLLPVRRILYNWRRPLPEPRDKRQSYDLAEDLQRLFVQLQSSGRRAVSPIDLVRSANVNVALQADAQEFSLQFLDWIDRALAERPGEEKLQDLFKGRIRTTVKCRKCNEESNGDNDLHDFALAVEGINSVKDGLQKFFENEQIDDYECSHCAQRRFADKTLHLLEIPRYLILHLLRFSYDRERHMQRKLSHSVSFENTLDLRPFLTKDQLREWGVEGCQYDLIAILIHLDSVYGGHYYARIRIANRRQWYTFNDADVVPYDGKDLGSDFTGAYLPGWEE